MLCLVLGRVVGPAPLTRLLTKTTNKVQHTPQHTLLVQQATPSISSALACSAVLLASNLARSPKPAVYPVMLVWCVGGGVLGWLAPPWRLVEGAWGAVAGATTATVRAVGPLLSLGGGDKTTTPKTRPLVSTLPLSHTPPPCLALISA
jgi:hypothetical protein